MIYKDPFANAEAKEGKWFAWYPVQLQGKNRTAWLQYVKRTYIEAAGYGMYIYEELSDET